MSNKLPVKFPFRYAEPSNSCMCIYKLSFGKFFFIGGCKRLHKRVLQHSVEIDRRLRLGLKPNDIYQRVIECIKLREIEEFVVTVLFLVPVESELPKYEQKILDLVEHNPACLNNNFTAQVRTYRKADQHEYTIINPITGKVAMAPVSETKSKKGGTKVKKSDTIVQNSDTKPPGPNPFADALTRIKEKYATPNN